MAFNNTYTTSPLENIIADIQKRLVAHKAQKIMYDYSEAGQLIGLSFGIMVNGRLMGVKLPARVKECEAILRKEGLLNPNKKDHALRVAWANIRDWVKAQLAMIDLGMVKLEEVFLPYVLDGEKTVYQIYEQKFNALPEGE